jgi:hypothetical protein
MDPSLIRCLSHQPTKGIDLFSQVSLANTTNSWIATHLAQGLNVVGQ